MRNKTNNIKNEFYSFLIPFSLDFRVINLLHFFVVLWIHYRFPYYSVKAEFHALHLLYCIKISWSFQFCDFLPKIIFLGIFILQSERKNSEMRINRYSFINIFIIDSIFIINIIANIILHYKQKRRRCFSKVLDYTFLLKILNAKNGGFLYISLYYTKRVL